MSTHGTVPEEERDFEKETPAVGTDKDREGHLAEESLRLLESVEAGKPWPGEAEKASLALHGLFDTMSGLELRSEQTADALLASVCSQMDTRCLNRPGTFLGEKTTLLGFDKNSGAAVIARSDVSGSGHPGQSRDFKEVNGLVTDAQSRSYKEVDLGAVKLYQDEQGALFARTRGADGKESLSEIPSLRSVSPADRRLNMQPVGHSGASADKIVSAADLHLLGATETPAEFFDRLKEVEAGAAKTVADSAIAQSNDYAQKHVFSGKLQDGFRTAGQFRQFAADGSFSATDRAATVVDRSRDERLREIIDDAKKQFADLPPKERAKALADYVNKIMGPANGDEKALDERYRKLMADNAGKEMLLSQFEGNGSCTQRALLLKVLADELNLESSIVRGNGGAHVWNTFRLDGKDQIYDTRGRMYGVESSPMHRPLQEGGSAGGTANDFVPGQRVVSEGKDWTVNGYDSVTGNIILNRSQESTVKESDLKQLNPGRELKPGELYKVRNASGELEDRVLQSRNPDGTLKMARVEEQKVARTELDKTVLEMSGSKNKDIKHLEDNWKALVDDNPKLSDQQKQDLRAARETLDRSGNAKATDFRALVEEISRLGKETGDVRVRIDSLTKVANTLANHPKGVFPPVETLIKATNVDALRQVADSLAQSAAHQENPPLGLDGTPRKDGKGYEHAAAQALQRALQDKAAVQKMIDAGKLPPGEWVYVPGAAGSALDNMKIDGMLVDLKTGKAIFIDFAMHEPGVPARDGGPYRTLKDKMTDTWRSGETKYPFALTLDDGSIGWDRTAGGSTRGINAESILARLGSYIKGNQATDLGLTGATQAKPHQYDLGELRKALGGEMVNFGPVANETEAAVRSEETGKTVKTVDKELADVSSKLKNHTSDALRQLGLSADSALKPMQEVVAGSNFFNQSLRAAVELDILKARESLYGKGGYPPVKMEVQVDRAATEPGGRRANPYQGMKYFSIKGDDGGGRTPSEVRIYSNGDVFVRSYRDDGTLARDFQNIGNVRDLKGDVAREIQKLGQDPAKSKALIDAFGDISKNFDHLEADLDAVKQKSISAKDFWEAHPELRLLADGIENGTTAASAAKDARPLYEARQAVEKDANLKGLDNTTKDNIAKKFIELVDNGHVKKNKFSVRDAYLVMELEKGKMSTADAVDAANLKRALRKEAESWTVDDVKRNFEAAKAAKAKDFPAKELVEVHRILDLQDKLKVDAKTAEALQQLRNKAPELTQADLKAIHEMHGELVKAGFGSLTIAESGKIFAKAGALTAGEIAEMGRVKPSLPGMKVEDLAQHAVRNLQVESLFVADKTKADAIRTKATELAKAGGVPLENVHDAAALMVLDNTGQAAAADLAKVIAEVRQKHHFSTFAELSTAAKVLESVRKTGAPEINLELEKLVVEGLKKHGPNLDKLKEFLLEEMLGKATDGGEHAKHWDKAYNALDGCKNAADVAKLLGLPADAPGQKAALEGFGKIFKPEVATATAPAAVTPMTLGDLDKKGLDVGKQLKAELGALQLTSHAQVTEFLKSCMEHIEGLKGDKKWSQSEMQQFEKLIEKYRTGDAAAVAAINAYLDLKVSPPAASETIGPGDQGGKPAPPPETVTLADLERRLQDPLKRAEALKKIEEEGPIRETLKKAGISEKRARELEKDLLSDKEEIREKAKKEIARYYESRGRGGFKGFTKEACGRLGALVMVAAVVLPFLLTSSDDTSGGPSATWSGGKGS